MALSHMKASFIIRINNFHHRVFELQTVQKNLYQQKSSIRSHAFYFPDRESIVREQKIDFEILTDLYVLRSQESEKVDYKKCPPVYMPVGLSVLCGGHREDTIVTINLKFGMWAQNVNISSRFSDIFFILIIKGSLP